MSDLQREAVSFVANYLVHSTLLIGAVWAFLSVCPIKSSPVREALWTVALFGGIATASVASIVPLPSSVRWDILPAESVAQAEPTRVALEATPTFEPESRERALDRPRYLLIPAVSGVSEDTEIVEVGDGGAAGAGAVGEVDYGVPHELVPAPALSASAPRTARPEVRLDPQADDARGEWIIALALAIAVLSILSLVLRTIGGLRGREVVPPGPLPRLLAQLCAESGFSRSVRLTHTSRLVSPVAFGLFRPEICVPTRAIRGLATEPQRAMLAHELAHLRRRDPLRLLLCRIVETVFFFQPLNRMARRRLFEVVECRCDAWAVQRLGYGVSLAECLAEVAGWLTEGRAGARPMSQIAMAGAGSPLAQRIRRLLREDEVRDEETHRRRMAPLSWLLLPAVVLAAPAIGSPEPERSASEPRSETRRHVAPVRPASGAETPRRRGDAVGRSGKQDLREVIDLLDRQIDGLAQQVLKIREALSRVPDGDEWLAALEPIERRLHDLEGRRALLRTIGEKLAHGDGLAPTPRAPSGETVESEEASDG